MRCRHCGEPTRRAGDGDGPLGRVVHAESGDELCADGVHAVEPTSVNPELTAAAGRVMADFPEYEVAIVFGVLFRAVLRGVLYPVPVEASTEEDLRRGIEKQIRMRRIAARSAERGSTTL